MEYLCKLTKCELKHILEKVMDKLEEDNIDMYKESETMIEKCVYDIAESISMTQSAVSHQLRVLKQARLIKSRRDGKNTFYSLDDDHVKRIIEQVMIHINEK